MRNTLLKISKRESGMALLTVIGLMVILSIIAVSWNTSLTRMKAEKMKLDVSADEQALLHYLAERVDCEETNRRGATVAPWLLMGVWGMQLDGQYYPILSASNWTTFGDWNLISIKRPTNTVGVLVAQGEIKTGKLKNVGYLTYDLCNEDLAKRNPYSNFRDKIRELTNPANIKIYETGTNQINSHSYLEVICKPDQILLGCEFGSAYPGKNAIMHVAIQDFKNNRCYMETTMGVWLQMRWLRASCLSL